MNILIVQPDRIAALDLADQVSRAGARVLAIVSDLAGADHLFAAGRRADLVLLAEGITGATPARLARKWLLAPSRICLCGPDGLTLSGGRARRNRRRTALPFEDLSLVVQAARHFGAPPMLAAG